MVSAAQAWPRTHAYLRGLPRGVDSHPECKTKASVALAFLEHLRPDADLSGIPEVVVQTIRKPPLPSKWISAVHTNVIEMLIVDQLDDTDAFLELGRQLNEKYLGSRLYRAAVSLLSPSMLLRGATSRWSHFQRGSTLTLISVEPTSASVRLEFPEHLFPPIVAREKGHSFRVALELSGAKDVQITVDTNDPTEAVYRATWQR